jgi:hypothetical protein
MMQRLRVTGGGAGKPTLTYTTSHRQVGSAGFVRALQRAEGPAPSYRFIGVHPASPAAVPGPLPRVACHGGGRSQAAFETVTRRIRAVTATDLNLGCSSDRSSRLQSFLRGKQPVLAVQRGKSPHPHLARQISVAQFARRNWRPSPRSSSSEATARSGQPGSTARAMRPAAPMAAR